MFGSQRTSDQFWAAGDPAFKELRYRRNRWALTLTGEGLQHMDYVMASTSHAFVTYDPLCL